MQILTKEKVLSINEPEFLFRQRSDIAGEMLSLSNQWKEDKDVMSHIILLFKQAKQKDKENTWVEANKVHLLFADNTQKKFTYFSKHEIDLGTTYIGSQYFASLINKGWEDRVDNFEKSLKYWKFPTKELELDIRKNLPVAIQKTHSSLQSNGFVIKKPAEELLLLDVNKHFKGNIPWAHIAWITSRCMHYACWLEYSQLTYGGFGMENIFINPAEHTISLRNGWWYATPYSEKFEVLNSRMLDAVPSRILQNEKPLVDRYLIRRLVCELLNDPTGQSLIRNKVVPEPVERWINMPPTAKAKEDYEMWYKALEEAFGKRKFTKLELTQKDIYENV